MPLSDPRLLAKITRPSIHPMFVSATATCFVGTLMTDLAYWGTANILWADFSTWLVTAGAIVAAITVLVAIFDYVDGRLPPASEAWPYAVGLLVTLILAVLNMLIHTRDAWTSVVPWGLALSVVVVLAVLFTGWMGRAAVRHHYAGVAG